MGQNDLKTFCQNMRTEYKQRRGIYVVTLYFQSPVIGPEQHGAPYLDHIQEPKHIRKATAPDPWFYNHAECLDTLRHREYHGVLDKLRENKPLMYQPLHGWHNQYSIENGLCFWSIDRQKLYQLWAHCKAIYQDRSPEKPSTYDVRCALHNWAATYRPELLTFWGGDAVWRPGGWRKSAELRMVVAAEGLLRARLAGPDRHGPGRNGCGVPSGSGSPPTGAESAVASGGDAPPTEAESVARLSPGTSPPTGVEGKEERHDSGRASPVRDAEQVKDDRPHYWLPYLGFDFEEDWREYDPEGYGWNVACRGTT